jgi:putative transposase
MQQSKQQTMPTEQNFYHTLNRGVDRREIFLDKQDYLRFIHNLYELNNEDRVETTFHTLKEDPNLTDFASRKQRKILVDILAFCLMPNHYHLLLSPRVEGGIPKFMSKINIGHAKYFNQKYKRVGTLFQGRYKQVTVTDETHFLHLPFYIHFNPLDLSYPEWRENRITNPKGVLEFLKSYLWSSHLDYLGIKNFPSMLNMSHLMDIFGSHEDYAKLVENYLKDTQIDKEVAIE